MTQKIGVGLIGFEPARSWAAIAHVPALRARPEYKIVAVSTRRQDSADEAARAIGIDLAFDNHAELVAHPLVDMVAVTVKVPHHLELVMAAIAAGKHVYCEWPLGNGLDEAVTMADAARRSLVHAAVGLQARQAPVIDYVRSLIADGYIGEVLSTTLVGSGMQWGAEVDRANAYIVDKANGATLLTIPLGHTVDALCYCLGEFQSLSATMAIRQPEVVRTDTGEVLTKTAEDQIAVSGVLESGAIASIHYRGGASRGAKLLWEINGTEGDLEITAAGGHAQIFDLTLRGGRGSDRQLAPLPVPQKHRWVPDNITGPAVNVAQAYACFANDIRSGSHTCPDFAAAVVRHRMIAAIEASAASGQRVFL